VFSSDLDISVNDKIDTYWLADDIHNLMVHENYINNIMTSKSDIKKIENLYNSAAYISDSDLFETSVNMTNWEIMPYIAYSTIQSTQTCNKKSLIKFPQFLGKISTMNKNKKEKIDYNNVKLIK
jgi:recombination DNA repair RAD52 pathway protein